MKRTTRTLAALFLAIAMLFAMASALAADKVTFSVGAFDLPATLEFSDEISVEGSANFDARWTFLLDKFNAKTEYVAYAYSTAVEQFRQMVIGGTLPDTLVCMLGSAESKTYAQEGLLGLLPNGFEEKYPNIKAMLDLIPIRESFQIDGQYFAIPRALEGTEPYTDYEQVIYFRKDLAKAAGVEIKDVYSIDELFDMYAKVQTLNPDMTMFSSIVPNDMRNIGLSEAIPQVYAGKEWFKNDEGKYVYAWAQPESLEGIKNFKKFYDAGFLRKEFFNDAAYEARDQFSAGTVFSYWDGLGIDFYTNVLNRYATANPGAIVEEAIACAFISVKDGKLLVNQGGNTWSEIYFSPEAVKDEAKLDAILSIYDYLLSTEGIRLNNFGLEGVHYNIDAQGNVVDIREKDAASGVSVPFNANKEVPDFAPIAITGAFADSSVLDASPMQSAYAKQEYRRLMDLRKNESSIYLMPYDAEIAGFAGDNFLSSSAGLKPINAIYKIIFENPAEGVEEAYKAWLTENQATIDAIAEEINAALVK